MRGGDAYGTSIHQSCQTNAGSLLDPSLLSVPQARALNWLGPVDPYYGERASRDHEPLPSHFSSDPGDYPGENPLTMVSRSLCCPFVSAKGSLCGITLRIRKSSIYFSFVPEFSSSAVLTLGF